jgi:protein-tyrosine kinase
MALFRQPPESPNLPQGDDPLMPSTEAQNSPQVAERSIGEILRSSRKLTREQVQNALTYQRARGGRFGDAAVSLGYAKRDDILWALAQQFHYPYAPANKEGVLHRELHVANEPFSDEVEAFRDLRSHLVMTVMAPDERKTALAIVSANIGDGKTFVAANLAVAFSQLPGRTLIVDSDLRSPRLHQVFGLENSSGLSNVLSGRSETNVIRPVPALPNLYMLPVGAVPPNPVELVQGPAYGLLMQELASKFDYVLVDTPAAAYGSDARLIAARVGSALVVGRRNYTQTKRLQQLVNQLNKATVQVAGVVMNDF